jgi:Ribbon-helix-helix protein, copG family
MWVPGHPCRRGPVSRSGTPTTPNAGRRRPMVTITLSPEALARLDALAAKRGQTRSGAIEAMIRQSARRT